MFSRTSSTSLPIAIALALAPLLLLTAASPAAAASGLRPAWGRAAWGRAAWERAVWERAASEGAVSEGVVSESTLSEGAVSESTLPEQRWAPPMGAPLRVSGPYRAPPHPYGSGHRGIDIPAVPGDPVVAPAAGTVTFSGTVVDRAVVSIRVDARTVVSLEPVTTELVEGGAVRRGAVLGTVSNGGHCDGECIHLGVRVDGDYVNPMRYFLGAPVLLPWG